MNDIEVLFAEYLVNVGKGEVVADSTEFAEIVRKLFEGKEMGFIKALFFGTGVMITGEYIERDLGFVVRDMGLN